MFSATAPGLHPGSSEAMFSSLTVVPELVAQMDPVGLGEEPGYQTTSGGCWVESEPEQKETKVERQKAPGDRIPAVPRAGADRGYFRHPGACPAA